MLLMLSTAMVRVCVCEMQAELQRAHPPCLLSPEPLAQADGLLGLGQGVDHQRELAPGLVHLNTMSRPECCCTVA